MLADWSKVLFVGWDDLSGVTHYRSILPANALGAEYVVFDGAGRGVARSGTNMKHDIIVVQHCWHPWQVRISRRMRQMGAKTFINVDDWIKALARMGEKHFMSQDFKDPSIMKEYYSLLREADGVIGATPWLVDRLSRINSNTEMARNGLDLPRYTQHRRNESNERIHLGWAGGTGHRGAFQRIVPAIVENLERHNHADLHLVGDDHRDFFPRHLSDRVKHHAWSDLHRYPENLAKFDINLAPAEENDFFKGKSQLRLYEACAMGTPSIAHPMYDEIMEFGGGLIASDVSEWAHCIDAYISMPRVLDAHRARCRDYAQSISIERRADEWREAIQNLASS